MAFKHTACFVITVMIVCNAVLYPSIFSTMFRQWFGGGGNNNSKEKKDSVPDMPPHMRQRGPGPAPGAARRRELDPRRPGGDSSASAFFAGGKQGGGDSGRGRGLMGSILPVYAVGILIYFAYIMYKIFLKDKTPENRSTTPSSFNDFQTQYGPTLERKKAEELQRTLSEELRGAKKKTAESKTAKPKASVEDGEIDVAALQKRLEDTEKAMQRMMDMMNNMGVAMNQVTKQLCSETKDVDDPGQQADDEVSDDGDLLDGKTFELQSRHSTDTEEEDDIGTSTVKQEFDITKDKVEQEEGDVNYDGNDLVEAVEEISMEGKEDESAADTVRRRHVGSTDGNLEETVQ